MAQLTLTLIGRDRPGLVRSLSERVAAVGGNWLDSRMARLAGQFAGILLVEAPDAAAEQLVESLRALEAEGLTVAVMTGTGEDSAPAWRRLRLELVGQDHPGIVRDIARTLAAKRVNIEELETGVATGSFSGERLFRATARLAVPREVQVAELGEALEALANELMVDLELGETDAA